ncbi:hypothetical protein LOK49_LG02G00319 [Camellia lanceoleosa]|uniref:Uncharacterized protein n=1 Tax=Camellia lanceoleosa TaxID=1840588 RepID=A0ACC0ILQ9_9ERIC|nr:hypothetical protein LOK49_LG02G00319 [Camellia lanceoleosa]
MNMFQPGRFFGPFIFYRHRLRLRLSSVDSCHHIPSPSTSTLMSTQINMDFNQWLDDAGRTTYDFWEWHGRRLIGMGSVFVELFSAIINYLKSLHEVDQYNGKLLSTMRIRPISVGRKSSFMIDGPKNISPDQVVVMDGICKDIDDLRTMVGMVGIKFPPNPFPVVWDLFFNDLYDSPDFHHTTLRDVKKVALCNYTHPIFFNRVNISQFIFKVHEIRKKNDVKFDRYVCLNSNPAKMNRWMSKIPLNARFAPSSKRQSPLRHVLYNRKVQVPTIQKRFNNSKSSGMNAYLGIVLVHCDDHHPQIIWLRRIVKELHWTFPNVLAKIHYQFVQHFFIFAISNFGPACQSFSDMDPMVSKD